MWLGALRAYDVADLTLGTLTGAKTGCSWTAQERLRAG
jgi:hypothetical protein